MLRWHEAEQRIEAEQVSLVLGSNYVLSFQEQPGDVFDAVRERIKMAGSRIRKLGPDYLVFALVDVIVDHYYLVLEQLGNHVAELEEAVFDNPQQEQLEEIQALKRQLQLLRRTVYPLREVLSRLESEDTDLIVDNTSKYFRDVYDHVVQLIDGVESYRDIASGLKDSYLSSVSFRMNKIMQVLTIISTIFIPLTFLAGIYGMNFQNMPELQWAYSYPVFWGVIVVLGALLLLLFRRMRWL